MIFHKRILFLLSFLLTTDLTLIYTVTQQSTQVLSKATDEKKEIPHQKIECSQMDLLNKLLTLKPINVLRMESAYATAREIMNYFSQPEIKGDVKKIDEEEKRVPEFKDKLLKPIHSFFENLYDYQTLLSPLIVKIFQDTNFVKTQEELNKTLMLQFFQVDKEKAKTFFEDILITKELLLKGCNEFKVLFGVVNASLLEEVKNKADELKQKAIANKKQQLAANQKNQTKK